MKQSKEEKSRRPKTTERAGVSLFKVTALLKVGSAQAASTARDGEAADCVEEPRGVSRDTFD